MEILTNIKITVTEKSATVKQLSSGIYSKETRSTSSVITKETVRKFSMPGRGPRQKKSNTK